MPHYRSLAGFRPVFKYLGASFQRSHSNEPGFGPEKRQFSAIAPDPHRSRPHSSPARSATGRARRPKVSRRTSGKGAQDGRSGAQLERARRTGRALTPQDIQAARAAPGDCVGCYPAKHRR